jgi:hypothetical protein
VLSAKFAEEAVSAQKEAVQFLEELKSGSVAFPNWDVEDIKAEEIKTDDIPMEIIVKDNVDSVPKFEEKNIVENEKRSEQKDIKESKENSLLKPRKISVPEPIPDSKTLYISMIPANCSIETLLKILNSVESCKVTRLLLSEPKPKKKVYTCRLGHL